MASDSYHIIEKQTLEVEVEEVHDALEFRNQLSSFYYERLFPKLENLFDEVCLPNQLIQAERLEIDIGTIDSSYWEEELLSKAIREIKRRLNELDKKRFDEEAQVLEIFFHFLQYGYLPWNNQINSIRELEAMVRDSPGLAMRVKEAAHEKNVLKRLAACFSESFCNQIVHQLAKNKEEILALVAPKLGKLNAQNGKAFVMEKLIQILCQEKIDLEELLLPENKEEKAQASPKKEKKSSPEHGIYIGNAGLVLLHPFLPTLFEKEHLVKNNNWIESSSQHHAIALLEHLACGAKELVEFELPLNKLLCGMELDEVLINETQISIETEIRCNELLLDVINHWTILRNTSVAGLRETFLQREGILRRVENGWLLKVQQKSVDILLNSLPWGIAVIKLPWMNDILYTEWI